MYFNSRDELARLYQEYIWKVEAESGMDYEAYLEYYYGDELSVDQNSVTYNEYVITCFANTKNDTAETVRRLKHTNTTLTHQQEFVNSYLENFNTIIEVQFNSSFLSDVIYDEILRGSFDVTFESTGKSKVKHSFVMMYTQNAYAQMKIENIRRSRDTELVENRDSKGTYLQLDTELEENLFNTLTPLYEQPLELLGLQET